MPQINEIEVTELYAVTVELRSGLSIEKLVPLGYELVKPDDKICEDDLVAYGDTESKKPFSLIDIKVVGFWSVKGSPRKKIAAGDVYMTVTGEPDLWRLIRKSTTAQETDEKTSHIDKQLEKEMMFFFGCKPSDPSKLPAPPKVVCTSYDEYSGW